jgi:putative oxidoreductase
MSSTPTTCAVDGSGCPGCVVAKALATLFRVALGALFIFSGVVKLNDPQAFVFAVKGFKLVENQALITQATFSIPWTEIVIGALLLLGFFTRAASGAMLAMLLIFTGAVVSVIVRDIDTTCGCFGKFLGSKIDGSTVSRNGVLIVFAAMVFIHKGGFLTLDARRAKQASANQPE